MVGIKYESMRKGQTSHKKEHNTRMCFPLKPVFTRDKGGLPNFTDEPTAGLDPKERVRIRERIAALAGDKVILVSTHVVSDIEPIAKEIILIKSGKIIDQDTVEHLCGKYGRVNGLEELYMRIFEEDTSCAD